LGCIYREREWKREGGREGGGNAREEWGREGRREVGREGGREGEREGGRERGREGGRESPSPPPSLHPPPWLLGSGGVVKNADVHNGDVVKGLIILAGFDVFDQLHHVHALDTPGLGFRV
jgi:hypothetical protein